MEIRTLLAAPVTKAILAGALGAVVAWAGGNAQGGRDARHEAKQLRQQVAVCDSLRADAERRVSVVTVRAESLQTVIVKRDEAWKRTVDRVSREGDLFRSSSTRDDGGSRSWLWGATGLALGLAASAVFDNPVTQTVTTVVATAVPGGHARDRGCKPPGKKRGKR